MKTIFEKMLDVGVKLDELEDSIHSANKNYSIESTADKLKKIKEITGTDSPAECFSFLLDKVTELNNNLDDLRNLLK